MTLQDAHSPRAARGRLVRSKSAQRSRIGNGALLPGVDQRSTWVRRAKECLNDMLADCAGEATSCAVRSLIRRAAVLTVELERIEQRFALADQADNTDLDTYQKLTNTLRRLLATIGLKRHAKDVTPSLGQLLREDQERQRRSP